MNRLRPRASNAPFWLATEDVDRRPHSPSQPPTGWRAIKSPLSPCSPTSTATVAAHQPYHPELGAGPGQTDRSLLMGPAPRGRPFASSEPLPPGRRPQSQWRSSASRHRFRQMLPYNLTRLVPPVMRIGSARPSNPRTRSVGRATSPTEADIRSYLDFAEATIGKAPTRRSYAQRPLGGASLFSKYAAHYDLTARPVIQQVQAIPVNRLDRPVLGFLSP